jgi:hypothetical protein
MSTPETTTTDATQVVNDLFTLLPDEILKKVLEYVPSLNDVAHVNKRFDAVAEEVDDHRWLEYFQNTARDLDPAVLTAAADDHVLRAWIIQADAYTTAWDGGVFGHLTDSTTVQLRDHIRDLIVDGLQDQIRNYIDTNGPGFLDAATTPAYDRIMQRWID